MSANATATATAVATPVVIATYTPTPALNASSNSSSSSSSSAFDFLNLTCFTDIGTETTFSNIWSGQSFSDKVFLFGYWDQYPDSKLALTVISTVISFLSLLGFVLFTSKVLNNPSRVSFLKNPESNVLPWWKNVLLPLSVVIWQALIGFATIANLYTGFTATTAEFIFLQGFVSNFISFIFLVLLVHSAVTWKFTLQSIFAGAGIYSVVQILFATSGNPYIQGIFDLIALVGLALNPILATVYLSRKQQSAQLVFTDILFFIYLFEFVVTAGICSYPDIVAIFFPVLSGVSLFFYFFYVLALLTRWNDDVIPSLF